MIDANVERDIREAIELSQLPASQVTLLIHGFIDTLPDEYAIPLRSRLSDRRFAILAHRCAKEAVVISTLRELFREPDVIDQYIEQITGSTTDVDLRTLRSGVLSLVVH